MKRTVWLSVAFIACNSSGSVVLDKDGNIVLGDEFTPDGCRLWDKETRKKMDKDRFRQGLGSVVETYIEVAERLGLSL